MCKVSDPMVGYKESRKEKFAKENSTYLEIAGHFRFIE